VRIDIPRMLLALRDTGTKAGKAPAWITQGLKIFRWIGTRPALFRLAGRLGARSTRLLAKNGWISKLPGPLAGWTRSRDFPAMASESFLDRWRREHTPRS
jgi:L-lactate dehydrogenase complex protein LldF